MPIPIANRIARYKAWLDREPVDRPMVGLLWEADIPPLPEFLELVGENKPTSPDQIQPEMFLPHVEAWFRRDAELVSDTIQSFAPAFGIPWIEAIAGCPVVGYPSSLWAVSFLESYDDRPPMVFDPDNSWLRKLIEFTQAMVDFSDGRFPVALPQTRGPLDILAAMRGPERMSLDLIEYPDEVYKILGELADLWISVVDTCLEVIPPFHGGYSTRLNMWAPGKAITPQNDISTLISPKMYEEFALPWDRKIMAHYPYHSFHLHGSSHHQIDVLLTLDDLTAMEVHLEHTVGGPPLDVMLEAAKRILEKKPLLLVAPDIESAEICIDQLPSFGLCVMILLDDPVLDRKYDRWVESHCARV